MLLSKMLCLILFFVVGLEVTSSFETYNPRHEEGENGLNEKFEIIYRLNRLETSQTDMKEENTKLKDDNRKLKEDLNILRLYVSTIETRANNHIADLQSQVTDLRARNKQVEKYASDIQTQLAEMKDMNEPNSPNDHRNSQSKSKMTQPRFKNNEDVDIDITETDQPKTFTLTEQSHTLLKRYVESDDHRSPRAQNEVNIAFHALLGNHHIQHAGINQNIVFDNVITNIGNGYNKYSGDFSVPVSGIYVFSATLMAYDAQPAHYRIMTNGTDVGNMYLNGVGGTTSAMTVILQLNKGDDVFIQNLDSDKPLHGYAYSTFSGFLLQQDFSTSEIIGK